jgi:hypothetical protein
MATAQVKYLSGEGFILNDLSGSGLGFYGTTFGSPVLVSSYQDSTWITNAAGTSLSSIKVDNCKYIDANTVEIAGGDQRLLREVPNYLATLNIRVEADEAVKLQNPKLRIFDRSNLDNNAVGVITKVAMLCHPWTTTLPDGSGNLTWATVGGSGAVLDIGAISPSLISPGPSGTSNSGANTTALQHDFYAMISASPITIGSKTSFGLGFSVEFI